MENNTITTLQHDRYNLTTKLGRGFLSNTYQGIDTKSGQGIIVKTLASSLRKHQHFSRFKQHFLRQAQRLSQCRHPHLAPVLDYFEENDVPYIIYQRIQGKSLEVLIESGVRFSEEKALQYIHQVSQALSILHTGGIQHLDLKPQNLIYCQDTDRVYLTDPCLMVELTAGIRQTHANLISPGYAAPEQYQLECQCTPATDIYALAATLYCLISGSSPPPAPLRKHIPFKNWQNLSASLTPQFKKAILQGMEMNIHQRSQTVDDWLAFLPSVQVASPSQLNQEINESPKKQISSEHPQPLPPSTTKNLETPSSPNSILAAPKFPLAALLMTSAIATAAGIGFGLAIRFNSPHRTGSTIFHQEQSFPPREEMNADSL